MDLLERDPALRALRAALAVATKYHGRIALVSGEAGIGKTSLVRRLAAEALGGPVWWGGCDDLLSPRPLGPVYDMAGAFDDSLRRLLGRENRRVDLFQGILDALRRAPSATLMVVEDLHWADAATLDLLKFVGRRVAALPLLLVLTYRDDELGERHPLRALLGDFPADAIVRVPLAPLSRVAVRDLARQAGWKGDDLYESTWGNPFFVTEALRNEGLPATVSEAVATRAGRLPVGARAVVQLAAIVPSSIERELVDDVLAPADVDLNAALASGLLVEVGGTYRFRHELARRAVEHSLAPSRARALHGDVLAWLERQPSETVSGSRLVHHADGAADRAAVRRLAPAAAREAAVHGSHRDAAALYATALRHAEGVPAKDRAELLGERAYQCYLTDQIDEAIAARRSALAIWRDLGDPQAEGHTLRWLSRLHWFQGRKSDAVGYGVQAVELLSQLPEGVELAWATSNRAQLHMLAGEREEASLWGRRAIALARNLDTPEVLAHALNNVGVVTWTESDETGLALLQESLRIALDHRLGEHVARAYANLVSSGIRFRQYPRAQQWIGEATAYFSARDLDAWANYVAAWHARLLFERGQWNEASEVAVALLGRAGVAPITRIPALAVLARIRQLRGDPGVEPLLQEGVALAVETGEAQRIVPMAVARAEWLWLRAQDAAADPFVREAVPLARAKGFTGEASELEAWVARSAGTYGDALPSPHRPDRAPEWETRGCCYEQALALMEGDLDAQTRGFALMQALGAVAAATRWRAVLVERGCKSVPRGPRTTTAAHPARLTLREQQVLALLADGLTNIEIAARLVRSEKTIDHHVSAVLRKLDAKTRSEAVNLSRTFATIRTAKD